MIHAQFPLQIAPCCRIFPENAATVLGLYHKTRPSPGRESWPCKHSPSAMSMSNHSGWPCRSRWNGMRQLLITVRAEKGEYQLCRAQRNSTGLSVKSGSSDKFWRAWQPSWYRSGWIMLRMPPTSVVKSFVCFNQHAPRLQMCWYFQQVFIPLKYRPIRFKLI